MWHFLPHLSSKIPTSLFHFFVLLFPLLQIFPPSHHDKIISCEDQSSQHYQIQVQLRQASGNTCEGFFFQQLPPSPQPRHIDKQAKLFWWKHRQKKVLGESFMPACLSTLLASPTTLMLPPPLLITLLVQLSFVDQSTASSSFQYCPENWPSEPEWNC